MLDICTKGNEVLGSVEGREKDRRFRSAMSSTNDVAGSSCSRRGDRGISKMDFAIFGKNLRSEMEFFLDPLLEKISDRAVVI